ncbi:MAG TPA: pectate lyase, partial [Niastella sp.]
MFRTPAFIKLSFISSMLLAASSVYAQKEKKAPPPPPPLSKGKGKLNYVADSLGNRIPDFSFCGYNAGDKAIPDAPIRIVVPVKPGDATLRIQAALDYVASLPLDKDNLRGAVLLQPGQYDVAGQLVIRASGVVLRGSGVNGTILKGTGKDRLTLISIAGKNDRQLTTSETKLTDKYIPVNSVTLNVGTAGNFKTGDKVIVHRPSTDNWIKLLHTDHFGGGITALGWKPGQRDLYWDRTIVSVNNGSIQLDAPITTALDEQYGGGLIASYNWPGRITNVGVENIRCVSEYDVNNPKDEAHRWMAITIDNVADAWVRQMVFQHFA